MGSLSFGEILTILFVILIVFGPDRLPELARRAGELVAKIRDASSLVTRQLNTEYGEEMKSIRNLQRQVEGIKKDFTGAVTSLAALDVDPPSSNGDSGPEPETDGAAREAAAAPEPEADDGPITSFDFDVEEDSPSP